MWSLQIPSEKGPDRDPALLAVFASLPQTREKQLEIRDAMRKVLARRVEAVSLKEQKLLSTFRKLHESWLKRLNERYAFPSYFSVCVFSCLSLPDSVPRKRRLISSGQMPAPKPKPRSQQSIARTAAQNAAVAAARAGMVATELHSGSLFSVFILLSS